MAELCAKCGENVPAGSQFCPRCGAAVIAPVQSPVPVTPVMPAPAATAPSPGTRNGLLIGIPVALILLAIIGWALLSGLPFSKDKTLSRAEQPAPSVVTEETRNTATTSQIGGPAGQADSAQNPDFATTTTAMPPLQQRPPETAPLPAAPPPSTVAVPMTAVPSSVPQQREITETQAEDVLRDYIASRDYYEVGGDCAGVASQGYRNGGYTINVVDRCGDRGRLGRWRVDAVTGELFVQKEDGRYLSP